MKAILIGTGPSLKRVDLSGLRGKGFIVAVKEAMTLFDFYDAVVSADWKWPLRTGKREQILKVIDKVWFSDNCKGWTDLQVNWFPSNADNSGAAAFDFVRWRGFTEIETYGFDYAHDGEKHHAYGLNPWYRNKTDENLMAWGASISNNLRPNSR